VSSCSRIFSAEALLRSDHEMAERICGTSDLFESFRYKPEHLVIRSQVSGCDGVVFGTIEMWGII